MAHSYASQYPPSLQVAPGIKTFFEDFFRTSDAPDDHEKYVDFFTDDAVFLMGTKKVSGRAEILEFRKSMWEKVATRLHSPIKVFPFGEGAKELMLYGTVVYGLKDGRGCVMDFAAKAEMVEVGGEWKMGFYQVYADPTAILNAK